MGKGTDKLYITHSEWSSEDAFGPSTGANAAKSGVPSANFKRLPFNFCAVSLRPFKHPVCTSGGTVFELTNILPWLKKHGTNPVNGTPLQSSELIKLNFATNDGGEYVDPVTYKVFTDYTHIVALKNTGNVYAWNTVNDFNVKPKIWKDLITDEEFKRADIITLQDPQKIESRNLSNFEYLKNGESTLTPEQIAESNPSVNTDALGTVGKLLRARDAVAARRAARELEEADGNSGANNTERQALANAHKARAETLARAPKASKSLPYNTAQHTTGRAAASFTSTGLTPSTSTERAILTDEEFMLKARRVKQKGYARLTTTHGSLNLELYPEYAPKAVWNFVQLAKRGFYNGIIFHRNVPRFMIQGGDPTGTGRGGSSVWGKSFADEVDGPLLHDGRGILSMANKGKDTNTSQFFITYRAAPHLNRKHTIFGRVVEGMDVLARLESLKSEEGTNRPAEHCAIEDVTVYIDPFEEFLKERNEKEAAEATKERIRLEGGTDDDKTTWTGKRIRDDGTVEENEVAPVGIYLKQALANREKESVDENPGEREPRPPKKKVRKDGGEYGKFNFDNW